MALELIRESGRPIAAPSANPFGQVSPTTAEHVRKSLGNKVNMVLDGGPCQVGVESTIISFVEKEPVLLRPGGLSLEEIEFIIGKVLIFKGSSDKPMAPGQLLQHYSPRTPLRLIPTGEIPATQGKSGWLGLQNPPSGFAVVEVLSQKGDLKEAAANFFAAMRRLDEKNLDLILAQPVPDQGLGRAINDRLYRASYKPQK
jgi:L-threonylcarbamoyladenylate synthase